MQLLTIEQAAERLTVNERSVRQLMSSGQLAWVDVSVKQNSLKPRKRIREADLFAFMEARTVQPPEPHTSGRRRRGHFFPAT